MTAASMQKEKVGDFTGKQFSATEVADKTVEQYGRYCLFVILFVYVLFCFVLLDCLFCLFCLFVLFCFVLFLLDCLLFCLIACFVYSVCLFVLFCSACWEFDEMSLSGWVDSHKAIKGFAAAVSSADFGV